MADGTVDVMEKEAPSLPSGTRTGKRQGRQRKPRMTPGERMAKMWGEEDTQGLGRLCGELGQKCQIEAVTAEALDFLTQEEGDELMVWLRWRTTWEDEVQGDGYKLCCDIFALPLRGPADQIDKFIKSGRLCEELVATLRQSGLASHACDFVFLPLALPLVTAASLTLDGISALRQGMTAASEGGEELAAIAHSLQRSFPDDPPQQEAVLVGMRLVRILEENEPMDIFRVGVTETVSVASLNAWGRISSEMGGRTGFFLGLPQDVIDAVAFLSAARANAMLDMYPHGPAHDYVVHACHVDDGLLVCRSDDDSVSGPVLVPALLASCCEEVLMEGIAENALDIVWHSRANALPGMPRKRSCLN